MVYYRPGNIFKYSRTLDDSDEDTGKLYDLDKDPEEKNDLIGHFDSIFLGKIRGQAHEHFTSF